MPHGPASPRPAPDLRAGPRAAALLLTLVSGVLLALLSVTAPASASGSGGEEENSNTVSGTLTNTATDGSPVAGVEMIARNAAGEEFTDTTADDGSWSIEVPGEGGMVEIELNVDTLPEGVELRQEDNVRDLNLLPGQSLPVLFAIGPDDRDVETAWDRVPGLVYSGLLFGLVLAPAALGLSMVFGTTGLTNFAHGELVTFGALITYLSNSVLGMPFVLSAVVAVVVGMAFGWAQDAGLWRPLRRRGTGLIAMMIVSIGLQFFLRNMYQYFTQGRLLNYDEYLTPAGRDVGGFFVFTSRDLIIAVTSIVVLAAVLLALSYSRLGRATRAVSDNPALASATGIDVDRVISVVWILGSGLAALAGVFLGFQLGVTFQIGQLILLLLFAAVTLGGLGSIWGAVIGALLIGILIDVSTLVVPADLKNAGALLLLIVILLVRPQGLLGRRERVG
ncbi:High-affinity branched-chain amino acid transport system permease protein LivH [Nocardioides aquaticus]|uniref:High-affinity branched-chain amino acid transport system permease protein LivH n=1 Tax=Nocardioides aquaticus TaxID=160826 RepID=A0ABX8EK77_9ACTN|nr:branched-chain amino acid ABC transporter permease [Nocardioides aquaticus]QVT80756.1 High-affinity branched-chain amino acid transport system permease protein LivH [Nocardioides aquaticus]